MKYRVKYIHYGPRDILFFLQQKKWWHLRWTDLKMYSKPGPAIYAMRVLEAEQRMEKCREFPKR